MTSASEYAFRILSTEAPTTASIRVRDSEIETDAGQVLHGIDTGGLLHLLVPLLQEQDPEPDERSAGVQIFPIELDHGGRSARYLDVVCRLPHLNALFHQVADEMLEEIEGDPAHAAEACRVVLDRWRELFERPHSGLLGPEALMGLLGELLIMEDLAGVDPVRALAAWTGPDSHRFDFVSGQDAIEVKTSATREGRAVEIHGVHQLEPIAGGRLHLAYVRLEARSGGAVTVPDLVDRIVMAGVSRHRLARRLEDAGCSMADRQVYARQAFDVRERLIYAVDDAFPRIIPGSFTSGALPPGVLRLRYYVELGGTVPAPLDETAAVTFLDRFLEPA